MSKKFITLTADLECLWASDYTLRTMPTTLYIRDPRFKVHGWAIKIGDNPSKWFDDKRATKFFKTLDWSRVVLQGHNLLFDAQVLSERYGHVAKFYVDSLQLSRAQHGTMLQSHSLDTVAKHFRLGGKLEGGDILMRTKGKRDLSPEEFKEMGAYAIRDNDLCYELCKRMTKEMPPEELKIASWTIGMATKPKLMLDTKFLGKAYLEEVNRKAALLNALGLKTVDLRSNEKFAKLLRDQGIAVPMKPSKVLTASAHKKACKLAVAEAIARKGAPLQGDQEAEVTAGVSVAPVMSYAFSKTDEGLTSLLENDNPGVRALVECRLGVKSSGLETRLKTFRDLSYSNTPMPITLAYCGAEATNRMSGSSRTNQQNLPRTGPLRQSITAPAGHEIVAVDSSQIEARIAAVVSGQQHLIDIFKAGKDPYADFASRVFGVTVDKNDPDPVIRNYRQIGKTGVLSLQYSAGWERFTNMVRVDSGGKVLLDGDTARAVVKAYRKINKRIKAMWEWGDNWLYSSAGNDWCNVPETMRMIQSAPKAFLMPSGLGIIYPSLRADPTGRGGFVFGEGRHFQGVYGGSVFARLVQSLARDVLMWQTGQLLNQGITPCHTVHDELLFVVPKRSVASLTDKVVKVMKTAPPWIPDLPVSCEAKHGFRYSDCK